MKNKNLTDKLNKEKHLDKNEWIRLFDTWDEDDRAYAAGIAKEIAQSIYGNKIYFRGIVEFSNICRNDCYYCGIRKSNQNVSRYCLTQDEITDCCDEGYELGFRTFVLQSGEHIYKPQQVAEVVKKIKENHPDCAVTLSLGEEEYETYKLWREAGADRYLLRHETANEAHYKKLHPENMSWAHRMECLKNLKKLGYQTGAGIMVGSPYQTSECLADDMLFFERFKPEMIGIGPFLPHKDTPFHAEPSGTLEDTLHMLAILRLLFPNVLLPATTALGTIDPQGRELGILAGANVIMPNLSPVNVRGKYLLYDGKICTGDEAAECHSCLERRMEKIGYHIIVDRGDSKVT